MGNTRKVLDGLSNSLREFMNDEAVLIERYRVQLSDLEQRTGIKVRAALFEDNDVVTERVGKSAGGNKAGRSNLTIGLDLTVWRGYDLSDGSFGELILADYKDKILDWSAQIDPFIDSYGVLTYFGYNGATQITRLDRTVSQTIRFLSERNLFLNQS